MECSGYLGNGVQRNVLPENYVLTDCFPVYSPGPASFYLLVLRQMLPSKENSGIHSFNNNRVPLVSASYGRSVLPVARTWSSTYR
jgi:hypothetical protein